LNGQIIPASQAHLPLYDAGVVLGATVTEMCRTFHHQLYKLDAHLERLFHSLHLTRIEPRLSKDDFRAIAVQIATHNAALLARGDDLALIIFVTPGEIPGYAGMIGRPVRTTPTVCIHTFPLPFELYVRKMQYGVHLITPSVRQVPPESIDPHIKCRSRLHYYLADKEAQSVDPEATALLLDLAGHITETYSANFLMMQRGTLVSAPATGTLPGISRATVIELAGKLGIPVIEKDIDVNSAVAADEVFLTSTPYCLMAVAKINGVAISAGQPGPIYQRLLEAWSADVGLDIRKQIVEAA
jgi:branched-subunit amino acid aminotransferase/4-amino-4-deoxychorismate lyase